MIVDLCDFSAGAIGGTVGILATHPLDTIRVRYQARQPGQTVCLRNLYRGVIPPMIGIAAEKAVVFSVYERVRQRTQSPLLAGWLAGVATATFVTTPFEHVKTNLQTTSLWNLRFRELSLRQLYKGYKPTLLRESGFAIYFPTYEFLDRRIQVRRPEMKMVKTMAIGGMSGAFSWIFLYPIDVIKSRLQTESLGYRSFWNCLTDTWRNQPRRIFYAGMPLGITRAFLFHAVAWTTYRYSKEMISKR